MNWNRWPFYPRSLTAMIGPETGPEDRESFVSLLASGCTERLGRPLTILEPDLTVPPDQPLKLRRIDQINQREHFAGFCRYLRDVTDLEAECQRCDAEVAKQTLTAAVEESDAVDALSQGYECHMGLLDQARVIRHHQTPVAVVFSGQFLPEAADARQKILDTIDRRAGEHRLTEDERRDLRAWVEKLETQSQFVQRHLNELRDKNPEAAEALATQQFSARQLFVNEVEAIQDIAKAQFELHKRDRENAFRHVLREQFPSTRVSTRAEIANCTRPILDQVVDFCGCRYLTLFVSPQRYISYETSPNVLPLFASAGLPEAVQAGITHFNWNKAGLSINGMAPSASEEMDANQMPTRPQPRPLTQGPELETALLNGPKGDKAQYLHDASFLYPMPLSDSYRGVLLWGPFDHLDKAVLQQEQHFLEELSELVLVRVLSTVQLTDSDLRTRTWEEVATLLNHYSRTALTPVSAAVAIIAGHLDGDEDFSRTDALEACQSLDTTSRVVADSVRAPLFHFAAMAEDLYRFAPTSLHILLQQTADHYRPSAMEKRVRIAVSEALAELPPVDVDAQRIRSAFGYVLENAIKYSHEDKEIRIYGEQTASNEVQVTIEDFGLGIDDDDLVRIFRPGVQGARSRRSLYAEGEGMGLYHAKVIVEAHKGSIRAGCRSGTRSHTSARLTGYRVWFTFDLPIMHNREQLDAGWLGTKE
jgi:signal transduction histidine kinase/ligand-binding sensor protein